MNFVFISPNYPHTYWKFCRCLKENGVTVLGIGDAPYFGLSEQLKETLTEYYFLDDLHDYDQVLRAVAFYTFKYGKIDWLESNNGYWLELDAHLRTDFNIRTGPGTAEAAAWKWRSVMSAAMREAEIPMPRRCFASVPEDARELLELAGYPLIAKPNAVGTQASRIDGREALERYFSEHAGTVLLEEFLEGEVCSYDAVTDSEGRPLFESMTLWPTPAPEVLRSGRDLGCYTCAGIPEPLRELGRRALKTLGVRSRFAHLHFLRVTASRPGFVKAGEWLALGASMRPANGYMPDMMNFAHSTDVYRIWADMVTLDRRVLPDSGDHHWCAYAGRRDHHPYLHSHEEILARYGSRMALCERVPESMSTRIMGAQMYAVHAASEEEAREFLAYVHAE